MSRRRVVVLASAVALLSIGVLVALVVVSATQTSFGRERVRSFVMSRIASQVQGRMYIGPISGSLFTGVRIDSLDIRDQQDSVLVATGPITVSYDPRDLLDRRILVRNIEIERPFVHLRQDSTDTWNFRKIFPSGPKRPKTAERNFGDFIVIDSATIRDGTLLLTMPWSPDDTLRGAKRDSAIAYNLSRTDKPTRRSGSGFARTWSWTDLEYASTYVRIADPDSAGRFFDVRSLSVEESDPPFSFRKLSGGAHVRGDSLWLNVDRFDLPGSTASASGKIVWGSHLPVRYDLTIKGDSVSLNDVNWVYPTLPRSGGGSMVLTIRNDPENLDLIDYQLTDLDVRTTGSRVLGRMTFAVGGPVLEVTNLDLRAAPVDFALLHTINGKPLPYAWRGQITGTVRGRGGPVNRFRIEDGQFVFHDANVRGAVVRGSARGELDILFPAFTKFRDFSIDLGQLDLRTIQFLNPNFPRLNGIVSGRAVLDSSWLDVRVRDADITHRDGPGAANRLTGGGRLTLGDEFITYDLALNAQPLSFTTLARSYPAVTARGEYSGPLRLQGTLDDLTIATELSGQAGSFGFDGRVDAYAPGFRAQGTGHVANLNLRALFDTVALPVTDLTARFEPNLAGDSIANLAGTLSLDVDRSLVDSTRIYAGTARLSFGNDRARVDSLRIESAAAVVTASGALGLVPAASDSLSFRVAVDSLGGLRRYLPAPPSNPRPTVLNRGQPPADSLAGTLAIDGFARGSIDTLSVSGTVRGSELWMYGDQARTLSGSFALRDVVGALAGNASLRLDTARIADVLLANATAVVELRDKASGRFQLGAASLTGPTALAEGTGRLVGDTTFVSLESARLEIDADRWTLDRPAQIVSRPGGVTIDTIRLVGPGQGRIALAGSLPLIEPITASFRADHVPLRNLGLLRQSPLAFAGEVRASVDVSGTRSAPIMKLEAQLDSARFGEVRLDATTLSGTYENKRLHTDVDLYRGARPALQIHASVPIDLSIASVDQRFLDDSLEGTIRSDSVDFGIIEAFSSNLRNGRGKFVANLDIGGTIERPLLRGAIGIVNGGVTLAGLGRVRFNAINADIGFLGDSIEVRNLSAVSGERASNSATLRGWASLVDYENPRFDFSLAAREFHVIDKPRVAELDVSANLRLQGAYKGSTLTGRATVDRGSVFIPELLSKNVISLDDPEFYNIVDTTLYMNRALLPKAPPEFVRNLQVNDLTITMGDEVWLRSAEANINLGGSVNVTVDRSSEGAREANQLALVGNLTTNRGTYRLNLGIVQRTFAVESGSIRFLGEADFNPLLNIAAIHTVRQFGSGSNYQEQDVRIRVRIGGTLAQPALTLESADNLRLSESDLLSYLVTGSPSFELGGDRSDYTSTAVQVVLRSANAYFSDRLRSLGLFDVVQFETSKLSSAQYSARGFLGNTRLGVGKQVGDRTFVSANAGLCRLFSTSSTTEGNPLSDIGFKIEQRLNSGFGIAAGVEPKTSALLCADEGGGTRGFVLTPKQWGLELFRMWRF